MYRGISKAGILAISTLLFSFSSNAQDEWASIGPKGVTATAIVFDTTGTTDKLRMTAAWDAWETSLDSPKWQAEGLNTINSPNGIVLDPLTAGGYYVTQDNTIIHVTPGSSPEILEPGDYGNELYVSPDGNTIYLLGFNTFRFSHNGGQNFYTGDIDYPDSPSVLKVDPNDPSTAYLFIQFHGDVYKTVDGGQTWSVFPTDATSPRDLVIDPADSQHIIVGGMDGIYETLNGGSTWSKLTADWATRLFANSDFSRLYLLNGSSRAFISSSTDGGSTWDEITPGVAGTAANDGNDTIYDLAAHPDQPDTLAIVQKSGVRISTDAGSSWTYLNNGIRKVAANRVALSATSDRVLLNTQYHSVQISNNAGTSWTRAVDGLELMGSESGYAAAINPVNDDVLLASTLSKIVRSTDGGASWSNVYEDLEYAFDIDFIGDAGEVIVGQQSSVLYSADSGATFDVISSGDIPFALVYSVDASPGDTWRIFATGGDGLQYTDDLGT
ncbi:MAG: hypothetical protein R3217_10485, partial [Gammaproteobacteria bacterium]|nr:hypothetical protein [Gammaproteobacteria bacterium]